MTAIVLSATSILTSQVKIIGNIGNAVSSFYAAETGAEQVLYIDRKQIPQQSIRGFCSICNLCNAFGCSSCNATSTSQSINGCDPLNCKNCRIKFNSGSSLGDKNYIVDTTVSVPDPINQEKVILNIKAKGFFKDTARSIEVTIE